MDEKLNESKKVYADFIESAMKNGMSELEATKVVLSIYEASSDLKLKFDEVYGVSLALERMVTKKRTAMQIMADAIGVPVEHFENCFCHFSVDVLSKFSAELERLYKV